MASTVVGNLVVNLRATAKQFGRDMNSAGRSVKNFGASLFKLKNLFAATVGAVAVRQVVNLGKEFFRLGASVEETRSKYETTFGAATASVDEFLDSFATIAGLSRQQAEELTATTGAITKGMGFAGEAAADFSVEMIKLAGDIASFNDRATEDAARALQSALIGNTEAARSFGIAFTEAEATARALRDTGKQTVAQLTQQERVTARLAIITERAGVQVGDLGRTSGSAANQAKQLGAQWRTLREELAQRLLPALTAFIPLLKDLASAAALAITPIQRLTIAALDLAGVVDQEVLRFQERFAKALAESGDQAAFAQLTYSGLVLEFEKLTDQIESLQGARKFGLLEGLEERRDEVVAAIRTVQEAIAGLQRTARGFTEAEGGADVFSGIADDLPEVDAGLAGVKRRTVDLIEGIKPLGALPNTFRDAAAAARDMEAELTRVEAQFSLLDEIAVNFALRFSDVFADALFDGAAAFKRFADAVIRDITRIVARFAVFKLLSAIPGLGPIAGAFGAISGFTTPAQQSGGGTPPTQTSSAPTAQPVSITLVGQGGASASRQITVEQGRAGGRDQVVNIPAFVMVGS